MICSGPCLDHCYNKNKITYFILGLFIGIFITKLYSSLVNKKIKKNKRKINA